METIDRSDLHTLIDLIPPEDLPAIEKILNAFAQDDPMARAVANAPFEDGPLTVNEREAILAYEAQVARGDRFEQCHPDDLLARLGFDPASK